MMDLLTCVVTQPSGTSIHVVGESQFPPLPLLFFGTILFVYGFILYRRYRLLQDTPRIHTRAVAMGFVHVHGKTVGGEPVTSPFTKVPCYYYSSQIENWDRAHHKWSCIHTASNFCNFYVDDGTGRVLVNPAGAKFELPRTFEAITDAERSDSSQIPIREIHIDTALGVAPPSEDDLLRLKSAAVANRGVLSLTHVDEARKQEILKKAYRDDAGYRFTETCLPLGQEVAVFGTCSENPNSSDVSVIAKSPKDKILLITSNQEAKVETKLRSRAIMIVAAGAVVLFLSFASCRPTMRTVPSSEVNSSK